MGATGDRQEVHPAFRFAVQIDGLEGVIFNECTLPSFEVDIITLVEGGFNTGSRQLPGRSKTTGRLVLKKGMGDTSKLLKWYKNALDDPESTVKNVDVVFYTSTQTEIMRLHFLKAFPIKWTGPTFKTADNTIAIESIELAYEEVA
jgi:phage tail-like protein